MRTKPKSHSLTFDCLTAGMFLYTLRSSGMGLTMFRESSDPIGTDMQITRLRLKNFRGFEDLDVELNPHLTVFAGINGSGKSSLLDALAVATGSWFLGFPEITPRSIRAEEVRRQQYVQGTQVSLENQFPVTVTAEGKVGDTSLTWTRELRGTNGKTTHIKAKPLRELSEQARQRVSQGEAVDLPVFAYYGTGRLWAQKRASQTKESGLSSRTHGYQDCLDPQSNHKLFEAWMRHHQYGLIQSQAKDKDSTDPLLETVSTVAAQAIDQGQQLYYDVAFEDLRLIYKDQSQQSFSLLSDGVRNYVALFADIAWRCVRLNPHLRELAPVKTAGVVLVDEIALHLHPQWQRTILTKLRTAFPNVQFIVSTHSPIVLSAVSNESIRFFTKTGEVKSTPVSKGLDVNTVLQDLMHVKARDPEVSRLIEEANDFIESGDCQKSELAIAELAELLGEDAQEVTALKWELKFALELPKGNL